MLDVGSIIKIKPEYIDEIYKEYKSNVLLDKSLITKKILNDELIIVSILNWDNDGKVSVFNASNINNSVITLYNYEVIDITRLKKLKILLECSK